MRPYDDLYQLTHFADWPEEIDDAADNLILITDQFAALQPDWDNAPEWAQWYSIDANGRAMWTKQRPKPGYPRNLYWENHIPVIPTHASDYQWAAAGEVDIPLGIDWRCCIWQRNIEEPSQ